MTRVIRGQVATLFALLTALVVTLAACGGGSSSTGGGGGGGSGSTVAGTVSDGVASVDPAGQDRPLYVALADMLVEPARAAPMADVPVTLSCPSYDQTVTTDPGGRFVFENVPAELCALVVDGSAPIEFDVGGESNAAGQVDGNGTVIHVEITIQAPANTVSGRIEDDASSDDDDSSGDGASEDDDSFDDASVDDASVDDDSTDDDSNDDGDSEDGTV